MKNLTTRLTKALLILAMTTVASSSLSAQIVKQIKADGFFMLPELGAAIMQQHDTLRVDMVPPDEQKIKEYASVDLKVGDIVLMFNGKRLSSAKVLEDMYKSLKPGEEIQLGIKRDEALRIVKFVKADESKLPKRQMMISTDDGANQQIQINGPNGTKTFSGEGIKLVHSAGIIVAMKKKQIAVIGLLPAAAEKLTGGKVEEGDVITALNGKPVATTAKLADAIDAAATGTKVSMTLDRKGTKVEVSFVKTEDPGMKIIKRDVK